MVEARFCSDGRTKQEILEKAKRQALRSAVSELTIAIISTLPSFAEILLE